MLKILKSTIMVNKDNRRARRCRSFGLLKYCVLNRGCKNTVVANPKDISANGVAFISEERLPINTILEIDIYLPPLNGFITVVAHVVRVVKIKHRDQYLVGAHFNAIDPADRARMSSYIEKLAADPSKQRYLDKQARHFRREIV